jgi:hypothetical protein
LNTSAVGQSRLTITTPKIAAWFESFNEGKPYIEQIGKESNLLEELTAGLIGDPDQLNTTYTDTRRDLWLQLHLPVLLDVPRDELRRRARMSNSALADTLAGRSRPRPRNTQTLKRLAVRHAKAQLEAWKLPVPRHRLGSLHAYLEARAERKTTPLCPVCGTLVVLPRATYCGTACKQKAYRTRRVSGATLVAQVNPSAAEVPPGGVVRAQHVRIGAAPPTRS